MEFITCLFDLDGTLFDSQQQIISSVNFVRTQNNLVPLSSEFIKKKIGLPAIVFFNDLDIKESNKNKLVQNFRSRLKIEAQEENKVFPGVYELLQTFKLNGVRLCVATNKPTDLAIWTVENSELSGLFSHIQGLEDFQPKPHPDVILKCLTHDRSKIRFMFGDRVEDMEASVLANVQGVGIAQSCHTELELLNAGAKYTFPSFKMSDNIKKIVLSN